MAPSKLSSVKNIQSENSLTSSPKQNSDGTIFVNIFINGTAVQAILDTGSPITIIPKSVFEQLEHSDEICASSVDATSITDNKLNFIGSANLKFTMCPGEYFYNVVHIYANDNVKPLIGNDLMALADIQINFAKKEVSSKGKPIPSIFTKPLQTRHSQFSVSQTKVEDETQTNNECNTNNAIALPDKEASVMPVSKDPQGSILKTISHTVVASETVTIPARSEVVIIGRICVTSCVESKKLVGKAGIVEPNNRFHERYPLRCARVLACPLENMDIVSVPVRVANLNTFDTKLYRCSTMASFTPEDLVDVEIPHSSEMCENKKSEPPQSESKISDKPVSPYLPPTYEHFDENQQDQLNTLLLEFSDIFANSPEELGRTNVVYHKIDTGNALPIKQRPYRIPFSQKAVIDRHIENMLKLDVIEPSYSPWASPIVIVKKKSGEDRFCIDYRKLNSLSKRDAFPIPRIDDTLDMLAGSKYFTHLDFKSGYWQIEVAPEDREKTAFVCSSGLYQWKTMPFGLTSAPGTFQRCMSIILSGLQWKTCLVYLDDVLIFSSNFNEHLDHIREIFQRLRIANLKLNPKKCSFCKPEVTYLGHVVSRNGIKPDPSKISAIEHFPKPVNIKTLRSFLGLSSYYRRFIPEFANIASPLFKLLQKNHRFSWDVHCENAFHLLKKHLINPPVMSYPDFEQPFEVQCDASDSGIASILSQNGRVISYASRTLQKHEKNYSTIEKECLAVIWSIKYFKYYLGGHKFTIYSDHQPLKWLLSMKNPVNNRLARWCMFLQEYDFTMSHIPGKLNSNADTLSRNPPIKEDPKVNVKMVTSKKSVIDINVLQRNDPVLSPIIQNLEQNEDIQYKSYILKANTLFHITEYY